MNIVLRFFSKEKTIFYTYLMLGTVIGLIFYFQGPKRFNNLIIYRQSLVHLFEHKNLFVEYPVEYYDIFLYHPTFTLLFSPFSLMPVGMSLMLWTVFCSLIIFFGIKLLPLKQGQKVFFWWFILIELATTLHSQQTNSIVAALGLFTFSSLEKGKIKWAALFPVLAFCIKGYGLIFASLFLFYPKPGKFLLYTTLWLVAFSLLPLPFVGFPYFKEVYHDWASCLLSDHSANFGYSLMGLFHLHYPAFRPSDVFKVQLAGIILFGVTWLTIFIRRFHRLLSTRFLFLSYSILWLIIFNHASEQPTFILAATGVAIFFLVNNKDEIWWPKVMAIVFLFLSIVAHKDIYPESWPLGSISALVAKTLPCVFVWSILQLQLLSSREKNNNLTVKRHRRSTISRYRTTKTYKKHQMNSDCVFVS